MAGDGLTQFVQQHAGIAAALLSACASGVLAIAGVAFRKITKAFRTIDEIKNNHLAHIQENTADTKESVMALSKSINTQNARLGTLIEVIENKL